MKRFLVVLALTTLGTFGASAATIPFEWIDNPPGTCEQVHRSSYARTWARATRSIARGARHDAVAAPLLVFDGRYAVTVNYDLSLDEMIAAGELDDTIIVGSGASQFGAVRDYTVGAGPNTVEVAATSAFTAPVVAYAPGATLTYGDPAQANDGAINLTALSDWYFEWIAFTSHGSTDLRATVTITEDRQNHTAIVERMVTKDDGLPPLK